MCFAILSRTALVLQCCCLVRFSPIDAEKEMSREEMPRESDVQGKRCQGKEMSRDRDVKRKRGKEMSGERDGTRKSEKQMSRERAVEGKGYQRESGPAHILFFFKTT